MDLWISEALIFGTYMSNKVSVKSPNLCGIGGHTQPPGNYDVSHWLGSKHKWVYHIQYSLKLPRLYYTWNRNGSPPYDSFYRTIK